MSNHLHEAVNFSIWNPIERLFPPIGISPQSYQSTAYNTKQPGVGNRSALAYPDLLTRLDMIIVLLFVLVVTQVKRFLQ